MLPKRSPNAEDILIKPLSLLILLASIAFMLLPPAAVAETAWVDDVIYVPLRTGPSPKNSITHKGLASGTAMEILEHDEEAGYYHIMLESGKDGYIPEQYVSKTPIAEVLLEDAKRTIEALTSSRTPQQKQLADLQSANSELEQKLLQASGERDSLQQRLESIDQISKSHMATSQRNKTLMVENEEQKNQIDFLKANTDRLEDGSNQEQFINGAGAVALGVILALLIPRLSPKKKGREWA